SRNGPETSMTARTSRRTCRCLDGAAPPAAMPAWRGQKMGSAPPIAGAEADKSARRNPPALPTLLHSALTLSRRFLLRNRAARHRRLDEQPVEARTGQCENRSEQDMGRYVSLSPWGDGAGRGAYPRLGGRHRRGRRVAGTESRDRRGAVAIRRSV